MRELYPIPSTFTGVLEHVRNKWAQTGRDPQEIADSLIDGLSDYGLVRLMILGQDFIENDVDEDSLDEPISMMYIPPWEEIFTDGEVLYGRVSDVGFIKEAFGMLVGQPEILEAVGDTTQRDWEAHDPAQAPLLNEDDLSSMTLELSPPELRKASDVEVIDHKDIVSRISELFWGDDWNDNKPGKYKNLAATLPDMIRGLSAQEVLGFARFVDEELDLSSAIDSTRDYCHEILDYTGPSVIENMWVANKEVYAPITDIAKLRKNLIWWAKDHIGRGNVEDIEQFTYDAFGDACEEIGINSADALVAFSELSQEEARRARIAYDEISKGFVQSG